MIILSHRGYWKKDSEKNTMKAFKRSFKFGFGLETDVRNYNSKIVISHDVPDKHSINIENLFDVYDNNLCLALNIKSDGLAIYVKDLLYAYGIKNYFVFDMSIPDTIEYIDNNMNVFIRQSDIEYTPDLHKQTKGIWLDELYKDYICTDIVNYINKNKKVCVVSPELHNKKYLKRWQHFKQFDESVLLCTDYPEKANEVFNDNINNF